MVNFFNEQEIDINEYIEHAILHPTTTSEQLKQGCNIALGQKFPVVCVYPTAVKQTKELLYNQRTELAVVIGFPSGASTTMSKLAEAQEAIENGADQLDMVINLGWLKEGKSEQIYNEVAMIVAETGVPVKTILETTVLNWEEKQFAAEICLDAGASYLKTSTGWFGGATVEDVKVLREVTRGKIPIKASGGIRHLHQAIALINAGASRLGTSQGLQILQEQKNTGS